MVFGMRLTLNNGMIFILGLRLLGTQEILEFD
jgi:hypothetical protein